MLQKASLPRFVNCISHDTLNGNIKKYTWDKQKIYVENSLIDDLLMLQNLFEGKIISSSIYPLIYDKKCDNKEISLRSLEFYHEVRQNPNLYRALSREDKIYFLIGLRDLFVASCRDLLSIEDKNLLMEIVDVIHPQDEDIVSKRINKIDVTPYPTSRNKLVRFIEEKAETIVDECFIRNEFGFLICFVDPQELSYHNFENIINLDSLFFEKEHQEFKIENPKKHPEYDVYSFEMIDKSGVLMSLDKYELYVPPLNKQSRGGERFIFSSEKLSQSLTTCITKDINYKKLINDKFKFVNYVFRYNKFQPNDRKFTSHFDTPYHDPQRRNYSKYTLILYLTSGVADPVLSIDKGKIKISKINAQRKIKGVIFDQRYEHEGKAFTDSKKIFIRSELIFQYDKNEVSFDSEVSKKFNIACYMTKQSVFNQELEKYASECFNQAAQARIGLINNKITKDFLISKTYKNIVFVTNGYDYWFSKEISLKKAAILALLDNFNCKFESGEPFNKLTYDEILDINLWNDDEIFEYLGKRMKSGQKKNLQKDKISNFHQEQLKTEKHQEESKNEKDNLVYLDQSFVESLGFEEDQSCNQNDPNFFIHCCGAHAVDFDPLRCKSIIEAYDKFRTPEKEKLDNLKKNFSIFIMDHKVKIEKSKMIVTEDSIIFDEKIPVINFAACWSLRYRPEDYMEATFKDIIGFNNVPPIPYIISEKGYHLKIELFNNSFVRKEKITFTHLAISHEPVLYSYPYGYYEDAEENMDDQPEEEG